MSGVDYQAVPTSPDLEAAGARNLALLAADASDLNANEAKPRHDVIMTLLTCLLQACCTMTLICAFVCLVVTIIIAKGGGRILMACLPGFTCGMRLVCLACQDGKGCIAGVPTFLIFLMLPMLEMPWKIMALEMVAAVASAVGLQLIGLLLAWLGFLCLLLPVTWQIALCVLPGILSAPCLWRFLDSPRSHNDSDISATTLLLWVLALPLSSFPWMLALLELPAYIAMCWLFQRWWHALFKVEDDAWDGDCICRRYSFSARRHLCIHTHLRV